MPRRLSKNKLRAEWSARAKELLVGRTITAAQYCNDESWGCALQITLDDGTTLVPSADDECNGPGAIVVITPADESLLPVVP